MNNFPLPKRGFAILLISVLYSLSGTLVAQCPSPVWGDEFDGTSLNEANWNYQIGDGCDVGICGWGNNELQSYQQSNVVVSNGKLQIEARKERIRGSSYTSGRINSKGKADFTYGRFEASVKLPYGDGLWPAFWMLSTNEPYGGWPQSGEIDIMEFVASQPDQTLGYIHYGDPFPNNQNQGNSYTLGNGNFPDAFHEFAIEWEPGEIRWFVDGVLFSRKTIADVAPYQWPFDQDMHFLLNVAVGGNLGGPVNNNMLPATMEVDYVRVYNEFRAYLAGPSLVGNQATGVSYSLAQLAPGTSVNWEVPAGAAVVSGQGSGDITVAFGSESGVVSATFNDGCTTKTLSLFVEVEPTYAKGFSFENFDEPATIVFNSTTGSLVEDANPAPDAVNGSALSGTYVRNASQQYDLLVYNVANINNAGLYADKSKKFYIDVLTDAPVGTEIIIQLETPTATASNYPSGRHSRYLATISENGNWHRLAFQPLDRPDITAPDGDVNIMTILFASNSFTGNTYYFDNLDSYDAGGVTPVNQAPSVSITAPSDGTSFSSGSIVTLTASASDSDGSISQVEFFANGISVGTDVSAPFSSEWTVADGSTVLTAEATDNDGAVTLSAGVGVTGQTTGSATNVVVASVLTGTASAGRGQKRATATVTITDNLGNPVASAVVSGNFSGTINESVSGSTDANGQVDFASTATAGGAVSVTFCVSNVVASLPYDPAGSTFDCNLSSRASLDQLQAESSPLFYAQSLVFYPNPVQDVLNITLLNGGTIKRVQVLDTQGREVLRHNSSGITISLSVAHLAPGVYYVRSWGEDQQVTVGKIVR